MMATSIFAKPTDKLVTFKSRKSKSQIDLILTRREHISKIKVCSTLAGEKCLSQHKLLRVKLKLEKKNERKERRKSKIKVWKLKDEKLKMEYEIKMKKNV